MSLRVGGAVLVALLICSTARSQSSNASQATDSSQIGQLLADAKNVASLLKGDIETLDILAGSPGQAAMLDLFTERANTLRSQALKLEEIRKNGSRWQQVAAERTIPVMKELASSTEAAIDTARAHGNQSISPDYREYLKLNADLAQELSSMIGATVDYAKTREELDRIEGRVAEKR